MDINELKEQDLIMFSASWCNPCKVIKPIVQDLINDRDEKITIVVIDQDEVGDAAKEEYGLRSVPTFVRQKDGEVVEKKSGLNNASSIIEFLES